MTMRNFILTLLASLAIATSVSAQPTLPAITPLTVAPSVRPSQAVFYDGFDSGWNTPWFFFQGTHLFDTSGTNGVLRLNVTNNISGQYAYIRNVFTNVSVLSDITLSPNSLGSSVGVRYNVTNGANYSAWIYPASLTNQARFVLKKYTNWFKGFELASANIADLGTNKHVVKLSYTNNVIVANLDNLQALAFTDLVSPLIPGGISLSILGGNVSSADYDNVTVFDLNQPFIAKPAISTMTKRAITNQGSKLELKVTASGNPKYNWYFGGSSTPIAGATNDTLVISNATTANAGFYKVTAENLGGSVYGTANATIFTTNILAECVKGPSSVTFVWDYNFTNEPTVNGFRIYRGSSSRTYTNTTDINTKVLTGVVTNLQAGSTNFFAITARADLVGLESDYSNELSYTTPAWAIKTNFTTNIYFLSAFGYPAIQTKVCPNQPITFWYTANLSTPFQVLTNLVADQYGNAVYDDVGARNQPQRFYRLSTP